MPEKGSGKSRTGGSTPPPPQQSVSSEDYPVNASYEYHPGGQSYVELISDIHSKLGRLSKSVETLETETVNHGAKLSEMGQDIHTAKITLKIVGAILATLFAFACWIGNKAVDAFIHSREAAPSAIQAPKR